ncbi:VOC family protein [Pukyongiella litopenaei]|uniref:VOC family protein n=1 Tax=Pukyongiella litopenaei TaxID=2605946 RepID=A0A2S0MSN3_9RHOB|nr:VOC family protein [Pukyongiella litopenaei]AVO38894.1 VOC family protein [Pukyongiella litopenaei]
MTPRLATLDHLVLTVSDIDVSVAFYTQVLGMVAERFRPADGDPRLALKFGRQKINLHPAAAPYAPCAAQAGAGTADLCFLTDTPLADWQAHLAAEGIAIEQGPVPRNGATGPIMSIYLRDPDGNLIEIATPAA